MNTYVVKRGKGILLFVLVILGVFFVYRWAKAGSNCTWTYVNGHYVCVIKGSDGGSGTAVPGNPTNGGGNNQGGGNKTGNNGGKPACTPTGQVTYGYVWKPLNYYVQGKQQCEKLQAYFDSCGNVIPYSIQNQGMGIISDCSGSNSTPTPSQPTTFNKCSLVYNDGSISCSWNFQWKLVASVTMPPIVIDTRPYPVTLVNWPTTMRVNSLATNSGSGALAYAGWGGGRPGSPRPGDRENITLNVIFRPTGNPVTVNLDKQPTFTVSASGGNKDLYLDSCFASGCWCSHDCRSSRPIKRDPWRYNLIPGQFNDDIQVVLHAHIPGIQYTYQMWRFGYAGTGRSTCCTSRTLSM